MTDRSRARRLTAHFSGADPIWDAVGLVLDTDRYLNMGYAPRYLPYPLVDSQTRLATYLGRELARALGYSAGAKLLDAGCGRGGPTVTLAREFGFDVTGVELVGHNAALARQAIREAGVTAAVCRGDARRLPVRTNSVAACVGVDSAQYVPEKARLLGELARVTEPGGAVAVSDLAITAEAVADSEATAAIERFADAWGLAVPTTEPSLRTAATSAGLTAVEVTDVTAHSVGRFGVWVALFQALDAMPLGDVAEAGLSRAGIDFDAVRETVAATRPALSHLRHVVLTGDVE